MDVVEETFLEIVEPCAVYVNCKVQKLFFCKKKAILDITIERLDGVGVSIADCAKVTRMVRDAIALQDPCPECDYRIEVGSPGTESALSEICDFIRNKGKKVLIVVNSGGIDNSNSIIGTILDVLDDKIVLECIVKGKRFELTISHTCIDSAKLMFE